MSGIVYINGNYYPAEDAKISIFDRGFLFGDAVYEVIPVYQSRLIFLEHHIKRLNTSLTQAKIMNPGLEWSNIFQELIAANGGGDLQIYLQITRGNQGERKHDIAHDISPSIVAFTIHTPYANYADKQQGLRAQLIEDIRWLYCNIKTTSLLATILLNEQAIMQGAHTAILYRNGFITEASSSNVFIINQQGVICTPIINNLCLAGITREITIKLLNELSWLVQEEQLPIESLFTAQEVWITSTTKGIYPVTFINDQKIGDGVAGKYWEQIYPKYQQLINVQL